MDESIQSPSGLEQSRRNMQRSEFGGPAGATSQAASMTTSRPFLNLLNPLGGAYNNYRGYEQARQDALDEEDEEPSENDEHYQDDDRGEGPSTRRPPRSQGWIRSGGANIGLRGMASPTTQINSTLPRVSEALSDLHEDDDDGEVPASFMIEARQPTSSTLAKESGLPAVGVLKSSPPRDRRRNSSGQGLPSKRPVNMPPRPSELQSGPEHALPMPNTVQHNRAREPGTWSGKRGLDDYERALWNWVNVYNLDAFLQEVCI